MESMDSLEVTGFILFLIILGAFIVVFIVQYLRQEAGASRLVILNVRTALFLPLYSFFIFIGLCAPNALAGLNVPITLVEGYSFYCFYSLIVANLGGPAKAVNVFQNSGKELCCCQSWCPTDRIAFYRKTTWALFHFLFTRTVVMILSAIAYYSKTKAGKALYAIFSLISTVLLVYALIHILLFYENVYKSCSNLFGITKAALLKVSVGLIVLEGLIAQFMTVTGDEPYNDDSDWSAEDKTLRGYCILVLIEYIILAVPYLYAFGLYKITLKDPAANNDSSTLSFGAFAYQFIRVHDVIGYLTYREDDSQSKVLNP